MNLSVTNDRHNLFTDETAPMMRRGLFINTIAVELWLNSRKRQSQTERMAARSGVQL
jgi:hypothetical protein